MDWREFAKKLLLANRRINELETDLIKRAIVEGGVVDRQEIEFLVELKREAVMVHPEFDAFFLRIVKKVVLRDGVINDPEAQWLRKILFVDKEVVPAEKRLLEELRREAQSCGKEFEQLWKDCTQLQDGDFVG